MLECASANAYTEAARHLTEESTIWLQIINSIGSGKADEAIAPLLSQVSHDNELMACVVAQEAKEESPERLVRCLQAVCTNTRGKSFYSSHESYVSSFRLIFGKWYQLLLQSNRHHEVTVGILHLYSGLAENDKSVGLLSEQILDVIMVLLDKKLYPDVLDLLQLVIHHKDTFFYTRYDEKPKYIFVEYFNAILRCFLDNVQPDHALALLEKVKTKDNYWHDSAFRQLCDYYQQRRDYGKIFALLQTQLPEQQKSHLHEYQVKAYVIALIKEGKIQVALLFIEHLLPSTTHNNEFIAIIETLIEKDALTLAVKYLHERIHIPGTKIRLQNKLQEAYLAKLEKMLGINKIRHLCQAHQIFTKYLQLLAEPRKQTEVDAQKNEANKTIVELRSQLDKAFLAFYRKAYGEPPRLRDKPIGIYFPVVPQLNGKSVKQGLTDYFVNMIKTPEFPKDHATLFQHLESIQPLHNEAYLWLVQLYASANFQKHESDLPFSPEIKGMKIDMKIFLPQLLDGITEQLLKLVDPKLDIAIIHQLRFTDYVSTTHLSAFMSDKYQGMFFTQVSASPAAPIFKSVDEKDEKRTVTVVNALV